MEIGFARSIGRKRVFNSHVSPLETLPHDILVK